MSRAALVLSLVALLMTSGGTVAQRVSTPIPASQNPTAAIAAIVATANGLLSSLDELNRAKVQFGMSA
jgi:hypothetical protein